MRILFTLTFLLIVSVAIAQPNYSSGNKAAIRMFEQALLFYDAHANEKAINALNDVIAKDPLFVEAYLLRGNVYEDQRKFENAITDYKKAISVNPDFFPNTYFSLGKIEQKIGKYEEAKQYLTTYIAHPKATKDLIESSNRIIISCDFAINAMQHPVEFNPVNMGDSINTAEDEYLPTITADGCTFIFTRGIRMKNRAGSDDVLEDFYISHFENNHWTKAVPIVELNTSGNEGAPSLSSDGQYLFFVGCEELISRPDDRPKGEGACDIFISKKVGDKFSKPRNLGPPVNTSVWESQPSFSTDGRTLYFIRRMPPTNGKPNTDIFVSFIDDNSNWSEPLPLPSNINTPYEENTVYIHPDDQTLYFSSNGLTGMGGFDIYMSKRQADGSWGDPVNLGYPINTCNDERSLLVSPQGDLAFFTSNRSDSRGQRDLYQFNLAPSIRPEKITYMKGKVYDVESKLPLAASFELIDLATTKTVVRSSSNSGNGEFIVCLPAGKSYALNVSRDGYLFYSDNFELKDPKSVKEPFLKDVPLQPLKVGASVILKNIFYDIDKYNLRDESKAELNKLIQFMNKNPKVKMEVSGHTDNTGTKEHNQLLSENRAKSVIEYMIKTGVSATRLSSIGYADTKPVADNKTEEGKAKNRRTEFLVTGVN